MRVHQTCELRPYPYVNIPKRTLILKRHKIDQPHVWAAFLAHPYLNMPKENITLTQRDIDVIYSFLQDNKLILRTLNHSSSRSYMLKKRRLVRKLVEKHKSFAEIYEFMFVLRQEILKILKTLIENGVEIIFIKSLAQIPLDSDNFDVLIKKQHIMKAKKILEDLGFNELKRLREYEWGGPPHKFLYRKIYNGIVMSIHLHTQVGWAGVKFVDEKELWNRIYKAEIDGIVLGFPSPEDHLLITVAHAFFENKCLKLSDLMYIVDDFQHGCKMDWNYILDCTFNGGWFEPFYAILQLADYIHESLFERKLLKEDILRKIAQERHLHKASSLEKELMDSFNKERTLPLKIPNSRIIMAFIKKIFATPHFSLIGKLGKIFSTSRSYIKRRLKRERPASLVCFSGQDGTGKTEHSKLLKNELSQRKISSEYVWSRGIGLSVEPFLRIGRLMILGNKLSHSNEYVSKRKTLLKREPIRTLWTYIMLIDEILLLFLKVRLLLLHGRVVICDRYILDVLVDAKCELGKDVSWIIHEFVKKLVPKPKIYFVLDANPEEIMKRKKDLNSEVVKCKTYHYLTHSFRERYNLINTADSLVQNREEILSSCMKEWFIGKN